MTNGLAEAELNRRLLQNHTAQITGAFPRTEALICRWQSECHRSKGDAATAASAGTYASPRRWPAPHRSPEVYSPAA
jgi:hypothetical protein